MNIIVCIKEVACLQKVSSSQEYSSRDQYQKEINPYDLYAIETAVQIKNKLGGKITAISMGADSARNVLEQSLARGVDRAILISDRQFAGADTLATASVLAETVKKIKHFDLVICGKQAVDGDTAQIGPSLAEKLQIPQITNVISIENINERKILCKRLLEYHYQTEKAGFPVLLTVCKDIYPIPQPSLRNILRAKKTEIEKWDNTMLQINESLCGKKGSQTEVIKIKKNDFIRQAQTVDVKNDEKLNIFIDELINLSQ